MAIRNAEAEWKGKIGSGAGHMRFSNYDGPFSFQSRMENGAGTNPEELLGAAHAGCFSMALAAELGQAGATPGLIRTRAAVHFGKTEAGFAITGIDLATEADVPGMQDKQFQEIALHAKAGCPVSKALGGTPITLTAKLVAPAASKVA